MLTGPAARLLLISGLTVLLGCSGGGGGGTSPAPAPTPDFSLAITPPTSIHAGSIGNATVSISRTNGHTAGLTLSLAANAQGITGTGSIAASGTGGTLAITVPVSLPPGTYTLTANATDGSLTRTSNFSLPTQPTVVLSQIIVNPINLGPGFPGMKTEGTFSVSAIGSNSLQLPNVEINVTCDSNAGWVFPSKMFTNGIPAVFRWVPGQIGNGKITITAEYDQVIKKETINTVSVNPPTLPLSALNIFSSHVGHASEYSVDITPLTDPRGTYYAAMVWKGGYAGLQRDGSRYHDQLQFSVWNNGTNNARIVTLGDGVVWTEFGGEGTGIACSLNYPWTIQTTYRFEMISEAVTGGKNVSLFVTNMSTSVKTFIATLFEPFTDNFNYYNSFVEQFHRVAPNCLEQPVRAYAIKRVMAKIDGDWRPLSTGSIFKQGDLDTICSNVEVYQHNFGLVLQIGGQSMSDPYVVSGYVVIP